MTPKTSVILAGQFAFPVPYEGNTPADIIRVFGIGETTAPEIHLAGWNGHEFEILQGQVLTGHRYPPPAYTATPYWWGSLTPPDEQPRHWEYGMVIYWPISPETVRKDWAGAIRAVKTADGKAWEPRHTDEGTHHDYELTLRGAITGVFNPLLVQYDLDGRKLRARGASSQGVDEQLNLIADLYGQVLLEGQKIARGPFLGEREQSAHPREGWLDRDITAAIAAVKAKWATSRAADLAKIPTAFSYTTGVLTMPAVETRMARVARIKAAEKARQEAAAAEAADPADQS